MMDQLIAAFPTQLLEALEIGKNASLTPHSHPIEQVLVTGLGGSGMGANIVIDLYSSQLAVPMLVNKGYQLPAFVGKNTLVIASSYSGNTEETVTALQQAMTTGAKIVCVASGGKIAQIARDNQLDFIQLPPNRPSPRACLGYSFVQQLFILHYFGFIDAGFIADITAAAELLTAHDAEIRAEAQELGESLYNRLPILYACDGYESVAVRWRQQINENGKILCWHHVIPEMNHNELVGWRTEDNRFAPVFLHADDVFVRNQYRMAINANIISEYTENIYHVYAKGSTHLQRMLYLSYLGDWVSWFIAQERNVDALEVNVIDYLKGELVKK